MTIIILHFLLKSFLFTFLAMLLLCKNIIPETKMGIHLLYIPLLPRSAIFNKSNFYFYWLQYTQYLRTDLITKGLLGNLLPPTFHGNETPGKLFCILFSSSLQTRLLAPTWDLRLVKFPPHYSQLCALCPRSPQTWKEMDVWIEIRTQAIELQTLNPALDGVSRVLFKYYLNRKSACFGNIYFIRWYQGAEIQSCVPGQVHINLITSIQMSEPNGSILT